MNEVNVVIAFKKIRKPLIFTVLAMLAVSYYIYLSTRDIDHSEAEVEKTPATTIISRDMDKNYPGTPRSVVEFYSDILKVWYKEDITDDEIVGLAQHARAMFDEELLAQNDYETYLLNLETDINAYKEANRYIAEYTVESGYNIQYITFKEESYAKVDVVYYVREGENLVDTYEQYTLRKDEEGLWKILFWEISDSGSTEE